MPYYSIRVQNIPPEGRDLAASIAADPWFKKVIEDAVSERLGDLEATLAARISRADKSVEAIGGVYIKADVPCDRCLTKFIYEEQIPFRIIMEPMPSGGKAEEDDGEDISEALDFSYYSGDEIDIGDIIRQHIVIAQPMSLICAVTCRGLCPECGKDLNKGECGCGKDGKSSPFAVLGQLKHVDKP